ncbi:MAG: Rrf2 family transcriptional regulator [Anaerolineae bacterium]
MPLPGKCDYALQIVIDAALHQDGEPITRRQVSSRLNLALPTLSRLLADLRQAGILESIRGRGGGYRLARRPSEVSVQAVLSAIGEPYGAIRCRDDTLAAGQDGCALERVWGAALESLTLPDLLAALQDAHHDAGPSSIDGRQRLLCPAALETAGVVVASGEGYLLGLSPTAQRLTGWAEGDALGRPVAQVLSLVSEDPAEPGPLSPPSAGDGQVSVSGLALLSREGRRVPVSLLVERLGWAGQASPASLIVVRDLTQERARRQQLMGSDRLEALAGRYRSLTEELGTAISAMAGSLSLALCRLCDCCSAGEDLQVARDSLDQARVLLEELLGLVESCGGPRRPVDLPPLIKATAISTLANSPLHLDLRLDADVEPVEADPILLRQLVISLLGNAERALPQGGTIEVELSTCSVEPGWDAHLASGRYTVLAVRDHGLPVPPDEVGCMFDPLYVASTGRASVGLPTARALAQECGGRLILTPLDHSGAEVRVYLPAGPGRHPSSSPADLDTGNRVLVVGEPSLAHVLRRMLIRAGFQPVVATSPDQAIELCRQAAAEGSSFRAMLVDSAVKRATGAPSLAQQAKLLLPEMTAALLAVRPTGEPWPAEGPSAGYDTSLAKPFSYQDLATFMARLPNRAGRRSA